MSYNRDLDSVWLLTWTAYIRSPIRQPCQDVDTLGSDDLNEIIATLEPSIIESILMESDISMDPNYK